MLINILVSKDAHGEISKEEYSWLKANLPSVFEPAAYQSRVAEAYSENLKNGDINSSPDCFLAKEKVINPDIAKKIVAGFKYLAQNNFILGPFDVGTNQPSGQIITWENEEYKIIKKLSIPLKNVGLESNLSTKMCYLSETDKEEAKKASRNDPPEQRQMIKCNNSIACNFLNLLSYMGKLEKEGIVIYNDKSNSYLQPNAVIKDIESEVNNATLPPEKNCPEDCNH